MLDSLFIINFKKYIQNILKQNKQIQNCEFRLKSPHTLEMICIRDDLSLFEIFYKIEISSIASNDIDIKNPNIFNHDDYYFLFVSTAQLCSQKVWHYEQTQTLRYDF